MDYQYILNCYVLGNGDFKPNIKKATKKDLINIIVLAKDFLNSEQEFFKFLLKINTILND